MANRVLTKESLVGKVLYVEFKKRIQRESVVYHVGPPMLIDARQKDSELDKVARLAMAMASIGCATVYQKRMGVATAYVCKPGNSGRRTKATKERIRDAERLASMG